MEALPLRTCTASLSVTKKVCFFGFWSRALRHEFQHQKTAYLAKELRMSPKEMVPLCKYLGATTRQRAKRWPDGLPHYASTPLTFLPGAKGEEVGGNGFLL